MSSSSSSRQPPEQTASRTQDTTSQPRVIALIPHAEMERNAQIARISAERERIARGDALRAAENELNWRALTGRSLSRDASARPLERVPLRRERER